MRSPHQDDLRSGPGRCVTDQSFSGVMALFKQAVGHDGVKRFKLEAQRFFKREMDESSSSVPF